MHRVIMDSSVCINAVRGKITSHEWECLCSCLTRKFSYFVSPLTFIELIIGLGRGDDGYYHQNLDAIRALLRPGDRFLKFPGHFVLDRVFGDPREKPDFEPRDFSEWASILLNAASKQQVCDGEVDLAKLSRSLTFGFDFDKVIRSQLEGQIAHVRAYESMRASRRRRTSEDWVNSFLKNFKVELTDHNRAKLSTALDATLTFSSSLCDLALDGNYNFEKHKNDWVDGQQLYYLADPQLYIVTLDGPLKDGIKSSSQSGRVVSPSELLCC